MIGGSFYQGVWAQDNRVMSDRMAYPFIRRELNQVDNHARGMYQFYLQLERLEKGEIRTVNIVHIGDSHIQADWFSGEVRKLLQRRFGSAGRGLVFPYRLAKTNSPVDIHARSNARWQTKRHVQTSNPLPVGVSGITLQTYQHDFRLSLAVDSTTYIQNDFNKVTIFTDKGPSYYDWEVLSPAVSIRNKVSSPEPSPLVSSPETAFHQVESGETLSGLATRYRTTVLILMELNELNSSRIYAGQKLRVPTGQNRGQYRGMAEVMPITGTPAVKTFYLPYPTQELVLTATKNQPQQQLVRLYGLVLENYQRAGILYHMIGVNSARFKHYNESPAIFEQLQALQPDLVIISLGTNEAVQGGFSAEHFYRDLDQCVHQLEQNAPFAAILLTSPPDARMQKTRPNTRVKVATEVLGSYALANDLAAWNFFDIMGGQGAIETWYEHGLAQGDRIHLTKAGYEVQGQLLYNALMRGYGAFQAGR